MFRIVYTLLVYVTVYPVAVLFGLLIAVMDRENPWPVVKEMVYYHRQYIIRMMRNDVDVWQHKNTEQMQRLLTKKES